jgi:voltage-gated potassium channel
MGAGEKGHGGTTARRTAGVTRPTKRLFKAGPVRIRLARLRQRVFEILEESPHDDLVSRLVNAGLITLIAINVAAVVLASVPALATQYLAVFIGIEFVSLVAFTVEYAARIWVADDNPLRPRRHFPPWLGYITSGSGLVDLLAVVPFWIALFFAIDLRVLVIFRLVRFLKLARYSPAMRSLLDALYAERRALFGCLIILLGATVVAASVMHVIEAQAQPDKFGTIPEAMWWAIVTLTTTGYGDVVPITPLGRVFGGVAVLMGILMLALPVGIVATAFANQIHRREFVVTWGMVARVPLFAGLTATEIADIAGLLLAQSVEPGGVVVRKGSPARAMYFIASGEVEIDLPSGPVHLGVGHFFGEIAVLRRARRSATVTAVTRTNLLVLDGSDLHALMERDPRLAERVREVARTRLGHDVVTPRGDIVAEELPGDGG